MCGIWVICLPSLHWVIKPIFTSLDFIYFHSLFHSFIHSLCQALYRCLEYDDLHMVPGLKIGKFVEGDRYVNNM